MTPEDRALAARIKKMRAEVEAEVTRLVDAHMAEHYSNTNDFWQAAKRASIEVATWSERKRRVCYAQDNLQGD